MSKRYKPREQKELICKKCGKQFVSLSKSAKYCIDCKGIG